MTIGKAFIRYHKNEEVRYGLLLPDSIREVRGDLFGKYTISSVEHKLSNIKLLPPVNPGKIIAIGLNYLDHAREMQMKIPEVPLLFLKPPSAVIGHREAIVLPAMSQQVDHEAELAIVIRTKTKNVSVHEAVTRILGYTCANDVTARDLQKKDKQWSRAKGFDTFCPLGPAIVTDFDPGSVEISCRVNDKVTQHSNTRQMIFKCAELVSFVSQVMTLMPADVILTGTPPGIGPLRPGDTVTVEIADLGQLSNTVKL